MQPLVNVSHKTHKFTFCWLTWQVCLARSVISRPRELMQLTSSLKLSGARLFLKGDQIRSDYRSSRFGDARRRQKQNAGELDTSWDARRSLGQRMSTQTRPGTKAFGCVQTLWSQGSALQTFYEVSPAKKAGSQLPRAKQHGNISHNFHRPTHNARPL